MTKRFVLGMLIAFVAPLVAPNFASAQTQNKLVFEIKSLKLTTSDISDALDKDEPAEIEAVVPTPAVSPIPAPPAPAKKIVVAKSSYTLPPRTVGDARVYMHEPEIRAYICPKLGDKCNTFIAVLKAENGTHECTRDNRGLNRNGSVDIGLAQINWRPGNPYHTFEQLQDCKYNLDVALEMYKRRGFQPWYAYTKGAYLKHLPAVLASARAIEASKPVEINVVEPAPSPEVAVLVTEPTPITN
ncbi:MAG: hypothetical protein KW804_00440 [Candidatus Doudnabacteria bacterium]|nr:hypothetical protein [Candidatus Doudnabacteria bacterium]